MQIPAVVLGAALLSIALGCSNGGSGTATIVPTDPNQGPLRFVDVTASAGLGYRHGVGPTAGEALRAAGGAACGDIDGDGWLDLYLVRGTAGRNVLLRNRGDGTFADISAGSGVDVLGDGCGPVLVDFDGDGRLDLFLGGVEGTRPRLFLGLGQGVFVEYTLNSLLRTDAPNTFSAAFADIDGDGDLDLFVTHWGDRPGQGASGHLWRNDDGAFTDVTQSSGIQQTLLATSGVDYTRTPNFADIDGDGDVDLLLASDAGTSRIYVNAGDGTFENKTSAVISDQNGSGAAVGDFDNDGHLDWFVAGVWLPPGNPPISGVGGSGNRLYLNAGDGSFTDATVTAGVQVADWAFAASAGDFDNDGHLDLVVVNGFGAANDPRTAAFAQDRSRLFLNNGDSSFRAAGTAVFADFGQGRGVISFDYDRDGDLDLLVTNNDGEPKLYRNDGAKGGYLGVRLEGAAGNVQSIGARIRLLIGGRLQMRELRCGSNYVAHDPIEAHFGVDRATGIDVVVVDWPDGSQTRLTGVAINQIVTVRRGGPKTNSAPRLADGSYRGASFEPALRPQ